MASIILASASPRRRVFLSELGLDFSVVPSFVEEHSGEGMEPKAMVAENARRKASDIFSKNPDSWAIAADTTVELEGKVFNKPKSLDEAASMLRRLSGNTHSVHTAVCILGPNVTVEHIETSAVTFNELSEERIAEYFSIVCPLDRAGAYSVQDGADLIVSHYQGSFSNIAGLPMEWLAPSLKEHGLIKSSE